MVTGHWSGWQFGLGTYILPTLRGLLIKVFILRKLLPLSGDLALNLNVKGPLLDVQPQSYFHLLP